VFHTVLQLLHFTSSWFMLYYLGVTVVLYC